MKFFHLSDLHIGLSINRRNLIDDQTDVFEKIIDAVKTEKPDAIVIAGDIYDRSDPSAEAIRLCNNLFVGLSRAMEGKPIMIISGNHDNCERIDYLRGIANECGIYLIGNPPTNVNEYIEKVTLEDSYGPINFYLLPFVNPSMVKAITGVGEDGRNLSYDQAIKFLIDRENIDTDVRNVIVSHQFYCPRGTEPSEVMRSDSEIIKVGNIDVVSAEYLDVFDYAALGHIHKPGSVGRDETVYSGTPIACSVSEEGQYKGITVVEFLDKNTKPSVRRIIINPLHKVRRIEKSFDELLKCPSDDYVSIIITDKSEGIARTNMDKIKAAFPNYIDIKLVQDSGNDIREEFEDISGLTPFDFCKKFASCLTDDEYELLSSILNDLGGDK